MNFVSVFMVFFSVLGAIDLIFKNRFGLGKEFEKGFKLFGTMALSMIGMIILAPFIGRLIEPLLNIGYKYLKIEPSIFPFMYIVSKIISKPLKKISQKVNINEVSAFGFFSTLATSVTTFEKMNEMDKKGIVFNSAFAISAAFTFAGHLAFTMSFDANYIYCVIIGKLISGIAALLIAVYFYKASNIDNSNEEIIN